MKAEIKGVDVHYRLGIGERYYWYLLNTFIKHIVENSNTWKNLLLHLSVKSMKEALAPEDLFNSALVFREYTQVRTRQEVPIAQPNLTKRSAISAYARSLMTKNMAKIRVQRSI